mgnify:CR=1 FL=1
MRILIDEALKHLYVLQENLILCKHGNILLFLTLKKNTISNLFYYIHIVEIPTNKGANSYTLLKLGNQISEKSKAKNDRKIITKEGKITMH